ncbi:MAG: magnesium transporter [Bacteroidota bacterium]
MAEVRDRAQKIDRVRRLLKSPNAHVRALLSVLHPTEIALVLEDTHPEIQERILRELPKELISEAISEMDEDTNPGQLLTYLHPEVASGLIKELDPDDAADLLAQIPEELQEKILYYVPDEEESVLNRLLSYDEDSAGGLMNPDVVVVRENMTKLEALRELVQQSEDEMEDFYTIYVIDDQFHLVGYLTFRALFVSRNNDRIGDIMERDVISVNVAMDQEQVAKLMQRYNLPTLPVLNKNNKLLGRITFDDVMDVFEEENTEDILKIAGVSEDENLRGGWAGSVRSRIPWLMINLCTASLAAFTLSQFETTIERLVIIAFMMPIIAGVAGNGGTQTLAVTIRRIATDGIPRRKAFRVVAKEVVVGAINGLMIGALVSLALTLLVGYMSPDTFTPQQEAMIGLVVFLAMFSNLILAGFAGSFIPIMLEGFGVDPAIASSILITAFTDIIGYLLLFGLATRILIPLFNDLDQAGFLMTTPF